MSQAARETLCVEEIHQPLAPVTHNGDGDERGVVHEHGVGRRWIGNDACGKGDGQGE